MSTEQVRDWIVTGVALGLAVLWMYTTAQGPRAAGVGDVRTLEDLGRVHDAAEVYPTAIRDLIGLEGTAEDTPAAVVEAAHERALELPPSRDLRLVVATMAAAWGVESAVREESSAIAPDGDTDSATAQTLEDLERLARGTPIDTVDRVTATLTEIGASSWLIERIRARHWSVAGDAERAAAADRAAVAAATAAIDATMVNYIVLFGFVVLGLLFAFAVPVLRPRLQRRGHGLGPGASPFRLSRTQQVVAGAFIAQILVAVLFGSLVGSGLLAQPGSAAVIINLQMLTHGVIWLALIQRVGRDPDDHRSLSSVLGLGLGATPGRGWTVAAWILPGLALCAFVTVAAQLLSLFIFDPPTSNQGPIELLMGDTGAGTLGLLLLGAGVIAPLTEEILFRGYLFRNLRGSVGVGLAVVFSGLVFGAVHMDPARLVPLTALGATLALLYEWSGTLLVPVIVHGAWNLLQLIGVWAIYHGS